MAELEEAMSSEEFGDDDLIDIGLLMIDNTLDNETMEQQLVLNPRHDSYLSMLDEKTIRKICENLDLYDQLQFGELDVNYQRIVGEHIISKQPLDMSTVSKHYPVRDVFRHYGEFMTALIIKESDIQYKREEYTYAEEIFRLVKKRCIAGKLESLTIHFNKDDRNVDSNKFLDVFEELVSLTIVWYREKLIGKLLANCTKLRSLKLQHMYGFYAIGIDLNFLMLPIMSNLHSLWIEQCFVDYGSWLKYVEAGVRPLKSLKIEKVSFKTSHVRLELNHSAFLWQIVHAFPSLETFSFLSMRYVNNKFHDHNYSPLIRLNRLEHVRMLDTAHSNLIPSLARIRSIQTLSLEIHAAPEIPLGIFSLKNLRSVEFFNPRKAFINVYTSFMTLPLLTECSLTVLGRKNDDLDLIILAIVMASERLRILKVKQENWNETIFKVTFYNDLVSKRVRLFPNAPPLQLFAQFRKMNRYKPNVIIQISAVLNTIEKLFTFLKQFAN